MVALFAWVPRVLLVATVGVVVALVLSAVRSDSPSVESFDSLMEWYRGGKFDTFQGFQIFVRDSIQTDPLAAAKPTLVALHGFPSSGYDFQPLWADLVQQFRVIVPDLLGYGFSDKPVDHRYAILEQTNLVEELLAARSVRQAHFICHDYSVSVCQELLHRQNFDRLRFRLRSVVFLNGGLFHDAYRPLLLQRVLALPGIGSLIARLMSRFTFGRSFARVFAPKFPPSARLLDETWALLQHNNGRAVAGSLLSYIAERQAYDERWLRALQQSHTPMILLNGVLDPVSGGAVADAWERKVSPRADDARIQRFTELGHYPHLEAPAQVLQAMQAFWHSVQAVERD